ncbi:MAG TPA: MoxR family ATPase [Burkholderiaceae bacterium]|jgi:MoxR-like ATPase|nr:MoxR family ATPase [Burkholderiaceae bacterium]
MTDLTQFDRWRQLAAALQAGVSQAVVGQERAIRLTSMALLAGGHVLLEGNVGVGKTTLLRAFARAVGGGFERIEGTVDMMPNDLIYHAYIDAEGRPRIEPGPLLHHGQDLAVFFFNEINRARPQVQSLLLRVMAERSVRAFNRDNALPFVTVFADRNRVEREETFELAAAARDRFMIEVSVDAPLDEDLRWQLINEPQFHDADQLLERVPRGLLDFHALRQCAQAIQRSVRASDALRRYALALWDALNRPAAHGLVLEGVDVARLLLAGPSPRAVSMLLRMARVRAWLDGRDYLVPEDLRDPWHEVMTHRLALDPVFELRRAELVPRLLARVLDRVPAP